MLAELETGSEMGLDVLVYNDEKPMHALTISGALHHAIFKCKLSPKAFKRILKIKDYYKTNIFFEENEKEGFAIELENIKNLLSPELHGEIEFLISTIRGASKKVRICGD